MSGPAPGDDVHLTDITAELALGALTGRQRARATAHLEKCGACRTQVQDMTATGTRLLELLPEHQPPAGFDTRVMGRLPLTVQRRRRRTRTMLTAAAGTVAVAAGLAGWGLRTMPAPPHQPASTAPSALLRSAPLITASHQPAGTVFLHGGSKPWLYMTVQAGAGNRTVICQLQDRDGRIITIGSFWLTAGHGHWGSPEPVPSAAITSARLITTGGAVLATASFNPTR